MERLLYLSFDSIISLLEMLISYKELRKASSYSENVDILHENKIISMDNAEKFYKIIGLRNILSHDYEKLDFKIIKDVVDTRLADTKEMIKRLESNIIHRK